MLPTSFRVERVDRSAETVLQNLFEHYMHDMAEWFDLDTQEDGRYAYPTATVWDRGDVFFAYAGRLPIGFALVGSAESWIGEPNARDLREFFVLRRYRRQGVGKALASYVWDQYPGPWLVRVLQRNVPALRFWRSTVATYAGEGSGEETRTIEGRQWSYLRFDSRGACTD